MVAFRERLEILRLPLPRLGATSTVFRVLRRTAEAYATHSDGTGRRRDRVA